MTIAYSGDSITFPDNSVQATAPKVGMVNRIINGAMVISQRNAGASVSVNTSTLYTLDRWQALSVPNTIFTVQQNAGSVTPPAGFTNYLGVTSTAATSIGATDRTAMRQIIEGFNVADLGWGTANAKTVTLSFWVRSSLTGTFGGALINNTGARSYPFSYAISSANTWTQVSITIAGDTTGTWETGSSGGINVSFGLGVGSTYSGTAGVWAGSLFYSATGATSVVGTSGATFYITGVQLEKGSTATSFDYRPYGTELGLCQRYFETSNGIIWSSTGYHDAFIRCGQPFVTSKRAEPTIVFGSVTNSGGASVTISSSNTTTTSLGWLGTPPNPSYGLQFSYTASAEL